MTDPAPEDTYHPHADDYGFNSPTWVAKSLVYLSNGANVRLALMKVIDYVWYRSREVAVDESGEEWPVALDGDEILDVAVQYLVTGEYVETRAHDCEENHGRQVNWRNPLLSDWVANSAVFQQHDHTGLTDEQKESEALRFRDFLDTLGTAQGTEADDLGTAKEATDDES